MSTRLLNKAADIVIRNMINGMPGLVKRTE
jgi:hypothetical protein